MADPRRPRCTAESANAERPAITEELLARAVDINEALAAEFATRNLAPLHSSLFDQMEELGVETAAAVSIALQRAHRVALYMHPPRAPRESYEVSSEAGAL